MNVRRTTPCAILAALLIALALLGCVAVGTIARNGRLPTFYAPLWFANKQAIIFFSGDICPAGAWRAACDMGLKQRVFSVTYWTPAQAQVLVQVDQN